jgi:hypothetical protein
MSDTPSDIVQAMQVHAAGNGYGTNDGKLCDVTITVEDYKNILQADVS